MKGNAMCGIAGIYSIGAPLNEGDMIRRMCDSIVHRGPDDEGYLFFDRTTKVWDIRRGDDTIPGKS